MNENPYSDWVITPHLSGLKTFRFFRKQTSTNVEKFKVKNKTNISCRGQELL
ncbi:hypothetical protein FDUTEX481_03484 [Tolypothrix sp. PCC 7601]|nr:hypothetical protein FDUTEX481_03484 [Tolypothrix sp. PCC 7601]